MEWNDPGSGIRENFAYEIRNPRLLNLQYSSRNPESHLRLESKIQFSLTVTRIQYQESGIHGGESRIQDCLGFPYMGQEIITVLI